jgi:hypothetical protein
MTLEQLEALQVTPWPSMTMKGPIGLSLAGAAAAVPLTQSSGTAAHDRTVRLEDGGRNAG